jgi:hypothetical protein
MDKDLFFTRDEIYSNRPNAEKKLIKDVEELKTNGIPDNQARQDIVNLSGTVEDQSSKIDVLQESKATKGSDVPVNVKDYGALGNGVADDTSAIQYALNNFDKVFIPKGAYNISSTLVVRDNTRLFLEGKQAREVNSSNCAILFPTANIDVVSLGDCSVIEGGIISTAKISGFSKSCVKIDYSTKYRYNNKINCSIIGNGTGYGVHIYGNGDGGQGVGVEIKGLISRFDTGFKGEQVSGSCWYTGVFIDAFIMNCTQAISTNIGSGGRFSGTFQPKIGTSGTYNTEERALVEIGAPNIIVDGLFWDVNTSINKYGLYLKEKAMFCQILSASSLYLKSDLKKPYDKINQFEQEKDETAIYPSSHKTLVKSFAGMQDNILFGAHKKFTVTRVYDNTLIYLYGGDNCFLGGDSQTSMQLYGSAPKDVDTPFAYEITFDKKRNFHSMGFSFKGGEFPYYYKMYRKINGAYVLLKEGNPNSIFYEGKDTWSQSNTIISSGRASGDSNDPFVDGIKFEFIINPSKDGRELIKLMNLFYKDGTTNENFLPSYGGRLFGDLNLNKNKLTNHVLEQNSTANRPTTPSKGQMFYDTTLNKPIWFNGTAWTDATGTVV